ncbi:MAG TPA: DUF2945 domain-containing protein [Ornithinimicrobium sp.]|uniref:DUF2945 domain-containing protein n=1 Tax=Ornithinimicrobium sp. TaxID=1977084 RepID=UPI002B4A376F|nr:DUF2945 domain-containing protein [Ornithinimicrobium sp.]HKJ11522.1 DUF2945 domain-containing protein [Ornithinimicrobium sp.]
MAFSNGDKVTWKTSQGTTEGVVKQKRVQDFEFKGQNFRPTDDDPYYIVESEKTGSQAAHKESALSPR